MEKVVIIYLDIDKATGKKMCAGYLIAKNKQMADKLARFSPVEYYAEYISRFEKFWQANLIILGVNHEYSVFDDEIKIYFKNQDGWERFVDATGIRNVRENVIV